MERELDRAKKREKQPEGKETAEIWKSKQRRWR